MGIEAEGWATAMLKRDQSACRRHADALLEILERRDAGPVGTAALDHLERCRPCSEEFQDLALAVIALRRFGQVPVQVGPSSAPWLRIRARIQLGRAAAAAVAWRWRTTLVGLATGTLIVAAVVGPLAIRLPFSSAGAEPVGYSPEELDLLGRRIEEAYLFGTRNGRSAAPTGAVQLQPMIPRRYPDGIVPNGKEVGVRPTGRPPLAD